MLTLIGTGFLSTHVRARWSAMHTDRTPEPIVLVGRRLPQFPLQPHETFMLADAFAGDAGAEVLERSRAIIHLASTSTVATYVEQPWLEFSDNVAPILQLCMRIARCNPEAKLIFASSGGAIYGAAQGTGAIAEDHPCAPISPYGMGKYCAEQAIAFVGRTAGLTYNILRISNPIGRFAHSRLQGLVSVSMNALETGDPVVLFGDGTHVRDLVDADDVADAIIQAAQTSDHHAHIWNVGSGVGLSNLAVLAMVSETAGRRVPVRHIAPRPQDVPSIVLNCQRIAKDLCWQPRRDIRETIQVIWNGRINNLIPTI